MDSSDHTSVKPMPASATSWREDTLSATDSQGKSWSWQAWLFPGTEKHASSGRFLDSEASSKKQQRVRWLGVMAGALAAGALAAGVYGWLAVLPGAGIGFCLSRFIDTRVFLRDYSFNFLLEDIPDDTPWLSLSRKRKLPSISDEDLEHFLRPEHELQEDLLDLLDLFSLEKGQLKQLALQLIHRRELDEILVKLRERARTNKVRNYIPWLVRLRFILYKIHRCPDDRSGFEEQACVLQWREDFLTRFIAALDSRIAENS